MIRIVDLFAGIGGIRLGFEQASEDIKCVFTSEINKHAQETYRANFGDNNIYGDITQINPEDIPDHDVLLAGFPCQPFSQAGLKKGFKDPRGTMFFYIHNIIEKKKPAAFMLENVKQLKTHDKGNTLITIMDMLKQLGYHCTYEVLRARDFGVPQNRERIIIVGFKQKTNFTFPNPPYIQSKLGDILEKNVDEKYTISDRMWLGHQRRKEMHRQKGNGFGYSIFNAESPYANTISARYYKDGSEILIEQTEANPRVLTPRECARLQGFPDSFKIAVSDTQAYKQFGNSVCVPLIKRVAENILQALD